MLGYLILGVLLIGEVLMAEVKAYEYNRPAQLAFWLTGEESFVEGTNGASLYVLKFPNLEARGHILISHGFTENSRKYMEVAKSFYDEGYGVYLLDHRGHGRSTGGSSIPGLVHVEDFDDYAEDLYKVAREVLTVPGPKYLVGHSMGGAISLGLLEAYPTFFDAAVLTAPMLGVKTGYPHWVVLAVTDFMSWLGRGHGFYPGSNKPDGPLEFHSERATSSKVRFDSYHEYMAGLKNFDIKVGGSVTWLSEALRYTRKIMSSESLQNIQTPILILKAGIDAFVQEEKIDAFCKAVKSCELQFFPDSKHEIYNERDQIFLRWREAVLGFFDKRTEPLKGKP